MTVVVVVVAAAALVVVLVLVVVAVYSSVGDAGVCGSGIGNTGSIISSNNNCHLTK
jgi:hypothetical protein